MTTVADSPRLDAPSWRGVPITIGGSAYIWIIIGASLDILFTGIILAKGGQEANPIANAVLITFGFTGMVAFKYMTVLLILVGCEFVSRHSARKGRRLAITLIVIHFAPVFWSTYLLSAYV
ncbi:MAG: DUF5658 family protein [Planctomycetota bacterium]